MSNSDFLGKGWAFPPAFFAGGSELSVAEGEEDIRQSLWVLLTTSLDERVMEPEYGTDLKAFLFEEMDQGLVNRMRTEVENAILNHEPRIRVEEVGVEQGPENGLLYITIEYLISATNNRYNLIYPFYLNEASI